MSGHVVGLDHVQVAAPAGCEEDARRFYGRLLGLEELEKPALLAARGGVWFRLGAHELHVGVAERLQTRDQGAPGAPCRLGRGARRGRRPTPRSGGRRAWADPAEIPGTSRFHVHDPWGNRLELVVRER